MSDRIGFIGLGIMGSGMARNLVESDHDLVVWNRTASRMEPLVEAGASAASSPAEVAARSDVVMIIVSDTPDVEEVVTGDDGVLDGLEAGALVVDHSSISATATRRLAEVVGERGGHWLDAPVSGGSEGAARGTLSVMVGGDADQLERVRPLLAAYATAVTHIGPTGAGQLAKIVNQILVVGTQLAVSEALLFAHVAGLDLEATLEAVSGGAAGSWMLANRGPQMIRRDWSPGFTIDLQQKDLRLALEAGGEVGAPLLGTALVHQLYGTLQREGLGSEGNHALVKALEALAGAQMGH